MKDHLVTLAGALGSLVLVTVLLFPHEPPTPPVSRPTSENRGELGLQGLEKWLRLNGVPTLSLRRRYGELNRIPDIPASGNLLLTSLPHSYAAHASELAALRTWIDRGNRILVLAAINDRPDWASLEAGKDKDSLLKTLGFRFRHRSPADKTKAGSRETESETTRDRLLAAIDKATQGIEGLHREERILHPAAAYSMLAGVTRVATRVTPLLAKEDRQLQGISGTRLELPLLEDPKTGRTALWAVRVGSTASWISSYPDLFGNRTLGEADNARLLRNLLDAALGAGGTVIFDDLHQGLSDLYDPEAFFADQRLWNSLWLVLAFWLLYVLGHSNRLAPPVRQVPRVAASDLVEAMAGLFARRLPAVAAGRGLLRHFFNEVRSRHKLAPTGEPCWEVLAADPGIRAQDLSALQRAVRKLEAGKKPDLRRLDDLIRNIRGDLR